MTEVLVFALSYILGSIPSGLILGKLIWNTDLREHGSHNIGATNAWRTLGKSAGIIIFLCDFLKGAIGVALADFFAFSHISMVIAGILAIVGHSASIFLGFKGGKGVATGLGVITMLMPPVSCIIFVLWFAIVYVTGYVSLGSCVAALGVPVLAHLFDAPHEYVWFGALAAILIVVRHKDNIKRLMNGTESKIKGAK